MDARRWGFFQTRPIAATSSRLAPTTSRIRITGIALIVFASIAAAAPADAQARRARIVSTSGIPHHDVGDLTKSDQWRAGMPRGFPDHPTWRTSIDRVLSRLAAEDADAYLHTGDMVSGRWGVDPDRVGVFGPTRTYEQRRRAMRRAADLYYRQNLSSWTRNGISASRVHFAMGDHEYGEIGANGQITTEQYRMRADYRRSWNDRFIRGRGYRRLGEGQQRHGSYAKMLPGRVGLVTLDPVVAYDGRFHVRIGGPQVRWLRSTLAALRDDGARWLIVQVEPPMIGPNHRSHSSGLLLENGRFLWGLAANHGVDLVLASEFHAVTAHSAGGRTPLQVVHGDQLYRAEANYLVIDVYDDRLELALRTMRGTRDQLYQFWAPAWARAPGVLRMPTSSQTVGRATLHADGRLTGRSGPLTEG